MVYGKNILYDLFLPILKYSICGVSNILQVPSAQVPLRYYIEPGYIFQFKKVQIHCQSGPKKKKKKNPALSQNPAGK